MTKTQPHYRARYDRKLASPPALPGSDELERTAPVDCSRCNGTAVTP